MPSVLVLWETFILRLHAVHLNHADPERYRFDPHRKSRSGGPCERDGVGFDQLLNHACERCKPDGIRI